MGQVLDLAAARERRGPRTEPMLTKGEIASHFKVSTRTITRWMDKGLPFDKPFEGGSVRYSLRACDAWFTRRRP